MHTTRSLRALLEIAFALAVALFGARNTAAHEFTLDAIVNAFVKVEQDQAHLVLRAPLYLLKSARFPSKNSQLDLGDSAAMERALTALGQGLLLYEDGTPLQVASATERLSLPSDRSFDSYERAVAHIASPIEPGTTIMVDQGYVDAHFVYRITSPRSLFSLRSALRQDLGSYVRLSLRWIGPGGDSRAMVVRNSGGTIDLNPGWWSAASSFVAFGIAHIAAGIDHLLFLLCLVIPLRGVRQLLMVVTGFTLAHSFTLVGSAFGLAPQGAWFPPFVELAIAMSIVYTAVENILGVDLRRRVLLAMMFGLVHGFTFSYGLKEDLQFAGTHLVVSLFAFNIGIELGQILALALMLPALVLVTRHVLPGRAGSIILAGLIAHAGWHWMIERWDALANAPWPEVGIGDLAMLLFWAGGLVLVGGAVKALIGSFVERDRAVCEDACKLLNSKEPPTGGWRSTADLRGRSAREARAPALRSFRSSRAIRRS